MLIFSALPLPARNIPFGYELNIIRFHRKRFQLDLLLLGVRCKYTI